MEISKPTEAELAAIQDDQKKAHVCCFIEGDASDEGDIEDGLEMALQDVDRRAIAAGMVVLDKKVLQSSHIGKSGESRVCITVLCQWMQREALERMQMQQRLMGQQNGGR